jgi:ubiquinone/menaquinone biosynthesis C-methylase UbiE
MDYQNEYLQLHKDLHETDVQAKVQAILNILPKDIKIHSILDIGCGSGKTLIQVAGALVSAKNTGVDISQKIINIAKNNDQTGKINWIAADIFSYNLPRHDVVLAMDTIEHVPDDSGFLNKISQFSDYIVIKVPIEINFVNRLVKFLSFGVIDPLLDTEIRYGHIHHYSIEDFLNLIAANKLRVDKIEYMHLPKRHRLFWELIRILFMPLWFISQKYYVEFNGGFLVILLSK